MGFKSLNILNYNTINKEEKTDRFALFIYSH